MVLKTGWCIEKLNQFFDRIKNGLDVATKPHSTVVTTVIVTGINQVTCGWPLTISSRITVVSLTHFFIKGNSNEVGRLTEEYP